MNGKQLAAIAAILIVAAPIGLGYILNFQESEQAGWQSDNTVNLSDTILNYESNYYNKMDGPVNNGRIIYGVQVAPGDYEQTLKSPAYVSASDRVTPLPIFGSNTVTRPFTYSVTESSGNAGSTPVTLTYGSESIPAGADLYVFQAYHQAQNIIRITDGYLANPINGPRTGPFIWEPVLDYYNYEEDEPTHFKNTPGAMQLVVNSSPAAWHVYSWFAVPFPTQKDCSMTFDASSGMFGDYVARINYTLDDGTRDYGLLKAHESVTKLGKTLTIGNQIIENVVDCSYVALNYGESTGTFVTWDESIVGYADPAYGWRIPHNDNPHYGIWTNAQLNKSIRMFAHLENYEQIIFTPQVEHYQAKTYTVASDGTGSVSVTYTNTDAADTTVKLGTYDDLMFIIGSDAVQICGVAAWPVMGSDPAVLNSVTIDNKTSDIVGVKLDSFSNRPGASGQDVAEYRVDQVLAVAGSFPSTKDYTLKLQDLWPETSYGLQLKSVAVFGDSLTFAGVTFPVSDGMITVNDKEIKISGAMFGSVRDQTTAQYVNTINDNPVNETATSADLSFNGEWSTIVTGYKMQPVTQVTHEWVAGGFGLDKQGFLLVGILTAAACAVGLGMVGRPSGGKMAAILLVCIGGGAILMILV